MSNPHLHDTDGNDLGQMCWTDGMVLTTSEHGAYTVMRCNRLRGHDGPHHCHACGLDHQAKREAAPTKEGKP